MLLLFGHVLDDQDLEVGPVGPRLLHRMGGAIQGLILGTEVPGLAGAERVGGQRAVDPAHQGGEPVVLTRGEQPAHLAEGRHAGEGPEPLDGPEDIEQVGDGLAQLLKGTMLRPGQHQLSGCFLQAAPGVVPDLPGAVVRQRARTVARGPRLSWLATA